MNRLARKENVDSERILEVWAAGLLADRNTIMS